MILKFIFYIIVGFKMLLFIIAIPHRIFTESSSQKPSQKHYTIKASGKQLLACMRWLSAITLQALFWDVECLEQH